MESANLHHHHLHQLQDQLVGSSSLSAPIPATYAAGSAHAWTQNIPLNAVNFSPQSDEAILNHRQKAEDLNPHLDSSVIQAAGSYWNSNARNFTSQSAHEQQLPKIKEELSDSFARFSEMLNNPSCVEDSYLSSSSYISNEQNDPSTKLKLKTISSDFPITGNQFLPGEIYSGANSCSSYGAAIPSRGSFSQIYPSINISNLNNQSSSSPSNTLDMNFQPFDLLPSARFSGSFAQTNSLPNFGLAHMQQQSSNRPSSSPSKISACPNEFTETKRTNSLIEPKATQAAASKKLRLEPRASYPPFKVRKEKLGDRIAALQQLVAPFGKTDTASVLMEAIGYIKFLQNQVETLSVPYMKASSNNNSNRTMQPFQGSNAEEGNEETKRDLRSRGLCLVPLSCMSYVTNSDGGGGIWPPPNFGGGT